MGVCLYFLQEVQFRLSPVLQIIFRSKIDEKKDKTQLKLSQKLCMRVGILIVATIYLQLIQNRYMFRSFTVLHCSHQHCVQPVASDVEVVVYL